MLALMTLHYSKMGGCTAVALEKISVFHSCEEVKEFISNKHIKKKLKSVGLE